MICVTIKKRMDMSVFTLQMEFDIFSESVAAIESFGLIGNLGMTGTEDQ